MDLKELEYILTIAQEENITKAAEKLFLTPSALTQFVTKLEKNLGTALFTRSRNGCFLTEAGKVYAESARQMLSLREETYSRIYDIAACKDMTLTIGFPPEHGATMFTAIYPAFHRKYPDIRIRIRETSVRDQQQRIAAGELDLGFLTLRDCDKTQDTYIPLTTEELLVAMPSDSPICRFAQVMPGSAFPVLDPVHLNGEPMAQMYGGSTFYTWTDTLFKDLNVHPNVMFETSRHSTMQRMVSAGLCFCMVTSYHCRSTLPGITYFSLPEHPCWEVCVSYRKNRYLSEPMKYLIRLAKDYWAET